MPEERESLTTSGEMVSPGFPSNYHNYIHERKTIKVAKGNVINIHFTDFKLEANYEVDYVQITDGDGRFLALFWTKHNLDGGNNGSQLGRGSRDNCKDGGLSDVTSFTETVHVLFHTDGSDTESGWRLEWSK